MKTTTYKCDRCGAESTGVDDIALDSVSVVCGHYNRGTHMPQKDGIYAEWCYKCRVALGVSKPKTEKDAPDPSPEPFTIEEMIREIAREEIGSG